MNNTMKSLLPNQQPTEPEQTMPAAAPEAEQTTTPEVAADILAAISKGQMTTGLMMAAMHAEAPATIPTTAAELKARRAEAILIDGLVPASLCKYAATVKMPEAWRELIRKQADTEGVDVGNWLARVIGQTVQKIDPTMPQVEPTRRRLQK